VSDVLAMVSARKTVRLAVASAERKAERARKALSRLETESCQAKERGQTLPESFWKAFSDAVRDVRLREREACEARGKLT